MLRGICEKLLVLLAVFSSLYHARSQEQNVVRVGVNMGLSYCNLVSNSPAFNDSHNWRFRFYAAVFQDIRVKRPFFIHTEVNYTGLGTKSPIDFTDSAGTIVGKGSLVANLHYVQVPVLAKLKFGKNSKGFVEAGPYFGLLVAAKGGKEPDFNTNELYPLINTIEDYQIFDLGLKIGLGVEIPILNEHTLVIGARFSQGFLDVTSNDTRTWNTAVSLHLGYMFEL
jgi:hypothetical protein